MARRDIGKGRELSLKKSLAKINANFIELWKNVNTKTSWGGQWEEGKWYYPYEIVTDGQWTFVCVNPTNDRPAPQAIGSPLNIYNGLSPTTPVVAKSVRSGVQITNATVGYWINSYEVYTVTGNYYQVYQVNVHLEHIRIQDFTATSTGWVAFPVTPILVAPGTDFALYQSVNEPDPTPITWTGDWNYTLPNDATDPLTGQVTHANRALSELRVSKFDTTGADRGAELLALNPGDIVDASGLRWSIQSIADAGAFVVIFIAPATQGNQLGVIPFTFETVPATPITTMVDVNYWLSNTFPNATVNGIQSIDEAPVVVDDNAYGVNIEIQEATVSPNWELAAYSG